MGNIIEVGQIWEVVTDSFLTTTRGHGLKRRAKLEPGEKIEIRYPYGWHFRTEDKIYFHAEPATILDNCQLFGVIDEKIRSGNKANLEEILRLRLYEPAQ